MQIDVFQLLKSLADFDGVLLDLLSKSLHLLLNLLILRTFAELFDPLFALFVLDLEISYGIVEIYHIRIEFSSLLIHL
jgi:hypothetical protein